MSIFDQARSRDTGLQRVDTILPVEVALTSEATGLTRPFVDRHSEWVVVLTLKQTYWANTAQRPHAEKAAIRCLAATLYEDVLREIPQLRLCIQSGDKNGALRAVDRIQQATNP